MIIFGIDPGTATTGYGIIRKTGNNLKYLGCGTIKTSPSSAKEDRLKKLYLEISCLLKKHRPEIAAVEKLYFFKNLKTAIPVSEARGVILLAIGQKKIKIREFTPLEVKMGITGYGRAEKIQVQRMVKELLCLKEIPEPDDAADALAIAIFCANSLKTKRKQARG